MLSIPEAYVFAEDCYSLVSDVLSFPFLFILLRSSDDYGRPLACLFNTVDAGLPRNPRS